MHKDCGVCFIARNLRSDFWWFFLSLLEVGWWDVFLFPLCRRLNELIFPSPSRKAFRFIWTLNVFRWFRLLLSKVYWWRNRGIIPLCCHCFRRKTMNFPMISPVSHRSALYLLFVLFFSNWLFWLSAIMCFIGIGMIFDIDRRVCLLHCRHCRNVEVWSSDL